jgi:hypothetical protein
MTPKQPIGSNEGSQDEPHSPAAHILVAWETYSQPAGIQKNTTTKRWKLLLLIKKSPKTAVY